MTTILIISLLALGCAVIALNLSISAWNAANQNAVADSKAFYRHGVTLLEHGQVLSKHVFTLSQHGEQIQNLSNDSRKLFMLHNEVCDSIAAACDKIGGALAAMVAAYPQK